jgi:glycosyltransferase involved in cell wall biosynthesis
MITIGVAAYNAAATLPELLESLLAQEYSVDGMEIVVADNGSTDTTRTVVELYSDRGPIRLVDASNRRGPAVARNAVIAAAQGEIVAFTDADCVAHPGWLAELEEGFSDPGVGCVAGTILPGEPHTPVERYYVSRGILTQDSVLSHPFMPYAQTANAAFRRSLFDLLGGFDEELITGEDADLLWRMQLETEYRLLYRAKAVVWHRHRSSMRGLWRQTIGWGMGHALVYKKYHGLLPREPWGKLWWDYRRVLGLASLSIRRWIGVRVGRCSPGAFTDAYLSLLFFGGVRLGRLKGSLAGRVFYP